MPRPMSLVACLVAAAVACERPSATPSTPPLAEFPYATATPDCAPWDGPAVAILFTATADTVAPDSAPYLRVGLYDARERLLRRTIRWPAETDVGGASWCVDGDDCMAADSGVVQLDALERDSVIPGRLRLVFPGGAVLDGSFRATWRPRTALCG